MADEQENTGTTPAGITTPVETSSAAGQTPAVSTEDLDKVRALVLQAHPDVVGDLVKGGSIDELIASVEPARTAYQQVAEKVRGSNAATPEAAVTTPAPPVVPAGGTAAVVDPATLGPTTKIAQALAARRKK